MEDNNIPIYLDYAASSPLDPRVTRKMFECFHDGLLTGTSTAKSIFGENIRQQIAIARLHVSNLIGSKPHEIIWTSGATESNNLAIKGIALYHKSQKKHIVTTAIEHSSVIEVCNYLKLAGFKISYVKPLQNGVIDPDDIAKLITSETILVSVQHVNNEIGAIQCIEEVGKITAQNNILFHVDGAQSCGKLPINVIKSNIDLLSISSHKMYGPKGIGALYIKESIHDCVLPLQHGGGQESGLRSGTLPTHIIVGMGEACMIALDEMNSDYQHNLNLREIFLSEICNTQLQINGDPSCSIPNIINIQLSNLNADFIISALPTFAFSKGSSCAAFQNSNSHVLSAIGVKIHDIDNAIRLSFGRFTSSSDIMSFVYALKKIIVTSNVNMWKI